MRMEEKMYYSFQDILRFLGIDYEFDEQKQLFTWMEVEKIIHNLVINNNY